MIRPTSMLINRVRDPLESDPTGLLLKDRLMIVEHLKELIEFAWPNETEPNRVAATALAFAKKLERDIKEVG